MKNFVALFAAIAVAMLLRWRIVCSAGACYDQCSPGVKSTYGVFNDIPATISEAEKADWIETPRPPGLMQDLLVMYCPDHKTVCCLYDDNGFIAGMQAAMCENEVITHPYPFADQGLTQWSTIINGTEDTCYVATQYYVNDETFTKNATTRLQLRDNNSILQEAYVWVTDTYNQIKRIPRDESQVENEGFTKQACLPKMGQHYYYNMTSDTQCDEKGIFSWFPLYEYGRLVGCSFMIYGNLSNYHLFENPPAAVIKLIVNNGPTCLPDMATQHGAITMHWYFCNAPQNITCATCPST